MSEKIKFAVIGQGHIGKRHADMVRRNPEAELIAVCDIAPKGQLGLNDLKELFYNSVEDLLAAHPEIEVVNVCTPNGLHAQHSLIALEAGKNVVCEKPMALTKADCEAMLFKALQVNKTVFCVMQKSLFTAFSLVKKNSRRKNYWRCVYGPIKLLLEPG